MNALTKRKLAIVILFAATSFFSWHMMDAQSTGTAETPEREAVRSASALWNHFLNEHLKAGDGAQKVRDVMTGKALDWGRLNWGGTGRYALEFKVDDFLVAEFQFDRSDKLESYRVFRKRPLWIKDPNSNILHQADR